MTLQKLKNRSQINFTKRSGVSVTFEIEKNQNIQLPTKYIPEVML